MADFRHSHYRYFCPECYGNPKKDIIIRGGENISCQEVEAALHSHPAVLEVAVFGLSDERLGEVPGAVVYLATQGTLGEHELRSYLLQHIASFKVPARIWIASATG